MKPKLSFQTLPQSATNGENPALVITLTNPSSPVKHGGGSIKLPLASWLHLWLKLLLTTKCKRSYVSIEQFVWFFYLSI